MFGVHVKSKTVQQYHMIINYSKTSKFFLICSKRPKQQKFSFATYNMHIWSKKASLIFAL